MTRVEFTDLLKKHNINKHLVVFDDTVRDGYCVRKNHFRREVLFRERGKEYDCIGFPCESDALEHLFRKLCGTHEKFI